MSAITTTDGVTVTTEESTHGTIVLLRKDGNPTVEAGRIIARFGAQGFQPAPFAVWLGRPATLRAIADLIEQQPAPALEEPAGQWQEDIVP